MISLLVFGMYMQQCLRRKKKRRNLSQEIGFFIRWKGNKDRSIANELVGICGTKAVV